MNKYVIFSLIGLAVITLSAGTAFAYRGNFTRPMFNSEDWQAKHEEMGEHHLEMQEIFANQDYDGWRADMEAKAEEMQERVNDMRSNITEENFAKMAEMHELMQAGDYEAVKELKEELGFSGYKRGFGGHMMGGFNKFH